MKRNFTATKEVDLGAKILDREIFPHGLENTPIGLIFQELVSLVSVTAVLKGRRWTDSGVTCGPAEVLREPEGGEEVWVDRVEIGITKTAYRNPKSWEKTIKELTISEAPELYRLAEGLCESEKLTWTEVSDVAR